jgi:hypothetical protein
VPKTRPISGREIKEQQTARIEKNSSREPTGKELTGVCRKMKWEEAGVERWWSKQATLILLWE